MESSLSRIIFQGRTDRFQGCSPSWFEAHWQLSINILHLNFHFPNAQFSLLRVYLEWGGNSFGAKLPTNNFGTYGACKPPWTNEVPCSTPTLWGRMIRRFEKTPLVNPNPPQKKTPCSSTWFSQLLWWNVSPLFVWSTVFVSSKPTRHPKPQGSSTSPRVIDLTKIDQTNLASWTYQNIPRMGICTSRKFGWRKHAPLRWLGGRVTWLSCFLVVPEGGGEGSKGLFLGKMCVFLLAMAQEMTYLDTEWKTQVCIM